MGGGRGIAILFAAAVVAGGIGWLASEYGDRLDWRQDGPRLFYLVALVAVVASAILFGRRIRASQWLGAVLLWGGLGLVAIVGYSYRAELRAVWERVAGELDSERPSRVEPGVETGGYAMSIRAGRDGHYWVTVAVDGTDIRMLVDTGATTTLISKAAAARAGIHPGAGDYRVPVQTASGLAHAAEATVRTLRIGDARFDDVRVLVMETPGGVSLLGMNTLRRFKSYEVSNGVLTLRW
jgi:aspartyl protease family protein